MKHLLLKLTFLAAVAFIPIQLLADEVKMVAINGGDTMKYDVTAIDAVAGQKITLTLTNAGKLPKEAMAHNFVLLKAGTDVSAFAAAAISEAANGYIPKTQEDKILVRTQLLGPGESETISFLAPTTGTYDFICTFPGHALTGMRGVLTVK